MARTTIALGKAGTFTITDTQQALIKDLSKGKPLSPESWRRLNSHSASPAFTALRNKKIIKVASKRSETRLLGGFPTIRGNIWMLTGVGKRIAAKL